MNRNPIPEEEICKMEQELAQALMRRDKAMVDSILAEDYILTTSDGNLVDKPRAMADLGSPDLEVEWCEIDDVSVRVYGDAAVAVGRSSVTGRLGDQDLSGRFRYTRVYARRQGRWQIVAAHLSRFFP
jgi:ketosteroid isomerase-like protein